MNRSDIFLFTTIFSIAQLNKSLKNKHIFILFCCFVNLKFVAIDIILRLFLYFVLNKQNQILYIVSILLKRKYKTTRKTNSIDKYSFIQYNVENV